MNFIYKLVRLLIENFRFKRLASNGVRQNSVVVFVTQEPLQFPQLMGMDGALG